MEPLEEAGVAVPFRAINSVRSGCALHGRSRCCFHRGRLFCWFWGLLRHLNRLRSRFGLRRLLRCLWLGLLRFCRRSSIPGKPVIPEQIVHVHLAVDKGLTGGRFHLLIAAVCPHLPGIDVIPQLQLEDIAQLLDEDRVLHPDTHLHAHSVLRVRKSPEAI